MFVAMSGLPFMKRLLLMTSMGLTHCLKLFSYLFESLSIPSGSWKALSSKILKLIKLLLILLDDSIFWVPYLKVATPYKRASFDNFSLFGIKDLEFCLLCIELRWILRNLLINVFNQRYGLS